ncbi:glycoside hydrolase family protein [Enterobacter cloacae]
MRALSGRGGLLAAVYDSLVSFVFNVGTGVACRSTLMSFLKCQQWWLACDQLTRWVFANGVRNPGLENRRVREWSRCMQGTK